jgi:putative membrane protein
MKTRNVIIGAGVAVGVLLIVGLVAGTWLWGRTTYGYGYGMYGMMGGYGFPWGMHTLGGGILMFLFWGLILGGGVWLIAGLVRQENRPDSPDETPLEIVKRRYARGEIDPEEFERIRETLQA